MRTSTLIVILVLVAGSVFSTASFAGCTKAQLAGTWWFAFSDGNYCKLRFNPRGIVLTESSVCVDPDRGTATPDSGSLDIDSGGECSALGEFFVMGVQTDLVLQFSTDRSSGAGAYYYPGSGDKGSFSMVRQH